MTCATVRRRISDQLDDGRAGPSDAAVADHVRGCQACARFERDIEDLRRRFRLAPAEAPPPVAARVVARLREGEAPASTGAPAGVTSARPSSTLLDGRLRGAWLQAAAVFVLAGTVGAAAVGIAAPPHAAAVDLRELVLAGQRRVQAVTAEVELVERGWHPTHGERTYRGELRYDAPETLWLRLEDTTTYPQPAWPANDLELGVDEDRAWRVVSPTCPATAMPECLSTTPVVEVRTGREPFDAADPVPLDLVVPVSGFATAGAPAELGERTIADRRAVGTVVTAAQLDGVLDVLAGTGVIRDVHPTDPVEVWLDANLGLPLEVTARAGGGTERARWAAARGYLADAAGEVLLRWRVRQLETAATVAVPSAPAAPSRDGGFVDDAGGAAAVAALAPRYLPSGMTSHRAGRHGDVVVASWSDGRAWLRVRAHPSWQHDRLFGGTGGAVRRVRLPSAGTAYLVEGGDRVLLHAEGLDVEVAGSVATDDLLRVADGLAIEGRPVPRDWAEAATATVAEAAAALPGLLLPGDVPGFAGPGVRVEDGSVVATWAGDGARAFVLTQRRGEVLGPPLDDVVVGVPLRGTVGRSTPGRGELQWVEDGNVVSLRSATVPLEELRAIAGRLRPVS